MILVIVVKIKNVQFLRQLQKSFGNMSRTADGLVNSVDPDLIAPLEHGHLKTKG